MADLHDADKSWQRSRLIVEQHADQLRARAYDMLRDLGEDGCETLTDVLHDMQRSDNKTARLLGTLAEVGFDATVMAQIMDSNALDME